MLLFKIINLIIGEKLLAAKNKNVPGESDVEEQSDIEVEQTQKKKSMFSLKLQI